MDELIVQAEPVPGTDNASILKLAGMLEAALKTKGLRTLVQMQAPGTLERTEFKAKRIIDQRDLYDEMTQG
jgi:phenylacetate-CoA ligase